MAFAAGQQLGYDRLLSRQLCADLENRAQHTHVFAFDASVTCALYPCTHNNMTPRTYSPQSTYDFALNLQV
jgi:hypothetical protein